MKNLNLPSNKKFGFFFSFLFTVFSIYFFSINNRILFSIFLILSLTLITISITKPALLHPLNKSWMYLGYLMGKLISPIILGIIFFLIFVPIGTIMHILGRDELKLKMKNLKSNWKYRSRAGYENFFKNQY